MQNPAGSEYDRLFYPFLFDGGKASLEEILAQVRHSTREKCREVVELRRAMLSSRKEQLLVVSQAMATAFRHGATLFAFGNGGSATDAQDLVADLLNPPLPHWRSLPALALTDDIAVITAVGNDIGFDTIFARQLIAFGKPGDIAVAISTSGNSSNLLLALEQAKKQGLLTVGFSGYDGGKMLHSSATDFCLFPPCDFLPRIQEAQATLYHTLIALVQALLQKEPGESIA
ncbi:MAG TPA: SIS domain-containing protein, partial [Ktedonobacteraceae bacterium]|nr:SIS domain-containing protein [Ktedonobacteraceae bacterium]